MKINLLLLLLTCFLLTSSLWSQMTEEELNKVILEANEQELVVHNSRMLQENFFYYADKIATRLLEINPQSANYNYRKGFILLEMHTEFEKAIRHLNKATGLIEKNFDMYSSREQAAPPDVFYHLGRAYHLNEEYDKAILNYNLFLEKTAKQSELISEAKIRIQQCDVAKIQTAKPVNVSIKNMGEKVNSVYGDYSSQVSLDGKTLHITSRREWENGESNPYRDPMFNNLTEDIYLLKLDENNNWYNPKKLDLSKPQINEASVSLSLDERKIYLYKDSSGLGDIFISEYSNDQFNAAEPIKINDVNTNFWETHLVVSPDGKLLYFVSDRNGGKGKRDIYFMEKKGGEWSNPKNLETINTEFDEESPFVGLDNNVLYFSSNNPNSMGGFDVFMTVRDASGNWSPAINLGSPVNSSGDDVFFTTTADGKKAYISSLRKGGRGEKDVYEIIYPQATTKNVGFLNGKIIHANGKKIPESSFITLRCKNCEEGSDVEQILPRIDDGGFFSKLEKCREYELVYYYKKNSPSPYKETFKTDCDLAYQEVYKVVLLVEEKELITKLFDYDMNGVVTSINTTDKTKKPLENATVDIYNRKGQKVETIQTNAKGEFVSQLTTGFSFGQKLDYYAVVSAEVHKTDTFDIKVTLRGDSIIKLAFEISTLKNLEEFLALKPIYFNYDKYDIRPDAALELDKVVSYLTKYPNLKIELGSHTDSRGKRGYNQSLSEKRAESTANYIKNRIKNPERITYKGYGESKLVNNCTNSVACAEEQHQLNRRTEFVIQK
jgi:outer membrane protein OmpA-like peptidoglycan-associated protein/tetratricopeptide (TPR) repeat protein